MRSYFIILIMSAAAVLTAADTKKDIEDKQKSAENVEKINSEIRELNRRLDELEDKQGLFSNKNQLQVKGFFDVNMSNYRKQPNVFDIGSLEVQLEHIYPQNIQVAAALVFDKKGARLGVGFIDYHIFGSSISLRGRLFKENGLHIQVGKFDVPFGADWQYFSAIDRLTVSSPLPTEKVMDGGYNDVGARMIFNAMWLNISAHVLRGIDEGYSFGGNSFGGRLGITPLNDPYTLRGGSPPFEAGFSYLYDIDKEGKPAEKLWAADIETKLSRIGLVAEYYFRDKTIGIRYKGYQATVNVDFKPIPLILFSRYDKTQSERYIVQIESGSISRVTGGFRVSIHDIAYIKGEYSRYLSRTGTELDDEYFTKNQVYLQIMVRF